MTVPNQCVVFSVLFCMGVSVVRVVGVALVAVVATLLALQRINTHYNNNNTTHHYFNYQALGTELKHASKELNFRHILREYALFHRNTMLGLIPQRWTSTGAHLLTTADS